MTQLIHINSSLIYVYRRAKPNCGTLRSLVAKQNTTTISASAEANTFVVFIEKIISNFANKVNHQTIIKPSPKNLKKS